MSRTRLTQLHHALVGVLNSVHAVTTAARERRSERGAALVEYTLLVGLVALVAVAAVMLIGGGVTNDLNNTARGFGP